MKMHRHLSSLLQLNRKFQPGLLESIIEAKLIRNNPTTSPDAIRLWTESVRRLDLTTAKFVMMHLLFPDMAMIHRVGGNPQICKLCKSSDLTTTHALVKCVEAHRIQLFLKRHDNVKECLAKFLEKNIRSDFKIIKEIDHQGFFQGKVPDIFLRRQSGGEIVIFDVVISESLSKGAQNKRRKYKEFTDENVVVIGLTTNAMPYYNLFNRDYLMCKDFIDEDKVSKDVFDDFIISLMMEVHCSNEEIWSKFI